MAVEEYIARDAPRAAAAWVTRIRARARRAAAVPMAGRVVPEFGRTDLREVFVKNYRIVYRVESHGITVLTVFESHRELRDIAG
jgi:plasmid stabilization system protein ParE